MKKPSDKVKNALISVGALILMWVIWIIAYHAEGNEYIIPSFSSAIKSLWQLLQTASFWRAFGYTLYRTVIAFVASFVLAAVCASLSALSKVFRALLNPFITVLRTIPTMAIILIILLWTNPKTAPIIVGGLVTFPMIYAQMSASFNRTEGELGAVIKVYHIKPHNAIFSIYLPNILADALTQAGAGFSLTLKIIVSAEVMANTYKSLGGMMQQAKSYLEIPELFALTIITVILGALFEFAFNRLSRITKRWNKGGFV